MAGSSAAGTPGVWAGAVALPRAAALVMVRLHTSTHTFGMVEFVGCSAEHGITDTHVTSDLQ
jgi:hypothetical protein